jgi:hypothetical protein
MSKDTLVVNLLAGSGAGKSTTSAMLFAMLKQNGVDAELVTEYVKDMVWEDRKGVFACQAYVFGKQLYRIQRLVGKVDVIVTDSPIILSALYDPEQDRNFRDYIVTKFNQFNNINFFLHRNTSTFNPNGRNEKTVEEAVENDKKLIRFLDQEGIDYINAYVDETVCENIFYMVTKGLNK